MKEVCLNVIEIEWEGPYSLEQVKDMQGNTDFGVYQIYGSHAVLGPACLLYIGKAQKRPYGVRFGEHESWLQWEASNMQVYIGRFGNVDSEITNDAWEDQINRAEKLLIYHCSPPYNSANIRDYAKMEPTIVLNYGKKNMLLMEVSTAYEDSEYVSSEEGEWQPYKIRDGE